MAPSYVQACITAVGLPGTLDELAEWTLWADKVLVF